MALSVQPTTSLPASDFPTVTTPFCIRITSAALSVLFGLVKKRIAIVAPAGVLPVATISAALAPESSLYRNVRPSPLFVWLYVGVAPPDK